MRKAIQKNANVLAIFAIVCTAVVGIVHSLTKDEIELQKQQQLLKTLSQVIDPATYNNEIINDCIMFSQTGSDKAAKSKNQTPHAAYIATYNDSPVAMAITATAPDGYNGNIDIIVGIKTSGVVSGVRVLDHNETPGLGDKIELKRNSWITTFTDKKINGNPDPRWKVAKDGGMFDQFTGATITPRAVVKAVHNTVAYFNENKETLFAQPRNCGDIE
ncbi:electron transport complex subunit RsxG [Pseudocolwellia agarivorans]|uniref:electron transport complex subunit RsxG n=1 Tax=Pseudocolwellia agarivorans TaxID=1911682 RepID=UPI0009879F33|nr:electron transport complex subunit RsxG [Pseudocolwellia agarivorans]